MKNSQIDFSDGHILKNIMRTSLPMLVAQVLSLLYSIVDRIYIARIPEVGTESMAGLGMCFPIITMVTAFTNLFGMGGAPLCSMARGKGNEEEAGHILNVAAHCLVLFSLILFVAFEISCADILKLFGADATALTYAVPYLRIYLLGTTAVMIETGLNPYINAQGFPRIGMMTVAIGAVTNMILDPIFIFLFGMGIRGAAIATVIAQILAALFVLRFLTGKTAELKLSFIPVKKWKECIPTAFSIASLGVSTFVMQITNSLVSIACNSMLMRYGGTLYVSVLTMITSVRQILDTPAMALAEGSAPMVSFNYGAKNPSHVRRTIFAQFILSVTYTGFMWIMIRIFPGFFVSIFSSDPAVREVAIPMLGLYFYAFVFQSLQYNGQSVFKALGKRKEAIFFSLFRKVVMVVPLTYLLPGVFRMGVNGVFMAEPISNFIGGSACFFTMLAIVLPELKRMEKEKIEAAQ